MLYLYAIIDRPGDGLPQELGLADQPISYVYEGGIGAVVSQIEPRYVTVGALQIVRHEAVVESLSVRHGVLPVRFGTMLDDAEAVRSLLRERSSTFADDLSRVRGRVEISLRALWADLPDPTPPAAIDAPRTGRGYIERRIVEERAAALRRLRAKQVADAVHARLDQHADASVFKVLPTERMLLSAAYLVPREDTARFQARVAEIIAARPEIRLLCTGPWPAYHFVSPA
ncbi:GvpL/GvpF family gas vesicle protein [Oscillochloris sp. ZM17-4]|uniref:GvpL/GvpF family gas vesicle protein n=1 Tax=Oscillochloris sp. ZM17-4 TaxID=2866714 RepID=UPI001C73CD71|nr:GvpL/GvpF family gas vesicle protein [Oscillochloris sp. ZM17-4]MBX0331583.1 GvpL/GvpF family gas vesicle protein [Oscillochloris sp. ZM17-4]